MRAERLPTAACLSSLNCHARGARRPLFRPFAISCGPGADFALAVDSRHMVFPADGWVFRPLLACEPPRRPPWPTGRRPSRRKNSPSNESSPNQTYRRNDVSEIHHRFHCHGCNRLCCVRAPALIDFRRGLRVRLLQLAADILGGFLSAHDHRHLDRNARMAARIWQANRSVMARGSGSGAV